MGMLAMQNLSMTVLIIRSLVKFPTMEGLIIVKNDYPRKDTSLVAAVEESNVKEIQWEAIPGNNPKEEKVFINPDFPNQPITIVVNLPQ